MADSPGSPASAAQNPQATSAGSAPVPYHGADQSPEPPAYAVSLDLADAPYYAGAVSAIYTGGGSAGNRDDVAGTVAGSVDAATGRWRALEADMLPQGTAYGDLVDFPPSPLDPGAGVGNTAPTGGFYDPVREYGGVQGAPGYQGEAQ